MAAPERVATSGKAVASLVLGILSLFLSLFASIPAIVLGILALRGIRRSSGRLCGNGLAVGGIALGSVALLLAVGFGSLVVIRELVLSELELNSRAIMELNESYSFSGQSNCSQHSTGTPFVDPDHSIPIAVPPGGNISTSSSNPCD